MKRGSIGTWQGLGEQQTGLEYLQKNQGNQQKRKSKRKQQERNNKENGTPRNEYIIKRHYMYRLTCNLVSLGPLK